MSVLVRVVNFPFLYIIFRFYFLYKFILLYMETKVVRFNDVVDENLLIRYQQLRIKYIDEDRINWHLYLPKDLTCDIEFKKESFRTKVKRLLCW